MTRNVDVIASAIREHDGKLIDNNRSGIWREVEMIAAYGAYVVMLETDGDPFTLKPIQLDDRGRPHLMTTKIGDSVHPRQHGSIEDAIVHFNDPANHPNRPSGIHVSITDVVYLDGPDFDTE